MRILVACVHFAVSSGRYICRALRRMGHDVRSVGPAPGHHIWGMVVKPEWIWEPDIPVGGDGAWCLPAGWKPDLVITADSNWTVVGPFDCPHVVWGCDNHVRNYLYADTDYAAVRFDALFLAHSWGTRMGEPHAHWLPAAYDPEDHYVIDPAGQRDVDVMLVGVMYPERAALVQALGAAGLKVVAGTGALYDDYRALYNRAKLSLVCPIGLDVPHRFVETMAMGCCVLSPVLPDAAKMGFAAYRDYIPYSSAENLVAKAKALLDGGTWSQFAAQGGRHVQGHTWTERAKEMLRMLSTMGLFTQLEKEPLSQ